MLSGIVSPFLLEILVCPVCHEKVDAGPLEKEQAGGGFRWLRCCGCCRCYPIQDGIPVMLEARAVFDPPSHA